MGTADAGQTDSAQDFANLDRVVQAFYVAAFEHGWEAFRPRALQQLCLWTGALAAAWLTRSTSNLPGEFAVWPREAGIGRDDISEITFSSETGREHELHTVPSHWHVPERVKKPWALALKISHRGAPMHSVVCLLMPDGVPLPRESLRRVIGHLAQAATLSLMQFIKRDEWLNALGRPSRGNAALVDAGGGVYVASPRFESMLGEQFGAYGQDRLPFPLPAAIVKEGSGDFDVGSLHFRLTRAGALHLLHARRPHPLDVLSPREQAVARALVDGKTFKTVSRDFGIAVSTVANHASRIYKKLNIYRREDLVDLMRVAAAPPEEPPA